MGRTVVLMGANTSINRIAKRLWGDFNTVKKALP